MALRTRLFQRSGRRSSCVPARRGCSLNDCTLPNFQGGRTEGGASGCPFMKNAVPKPVPSVITASKPSPPHHRRSLDVSVVGHAARLADRLGERPRQIEIRPGLLSVSGSSLLPGPFVGGTKCDALST